MAEKRGASSRNSRIRIVLAGVLVVMFLLLIGMGYFFVQVLRPTKSIARGPAVDTAGLEWVRSLYGYGPGVNDQLASPIAVAIAPDGTIYATDPARHRIMAFAPDGAFRYLVSTGGGKGKGKMERPAGLAVDRAGNIYASDVVAQKVIVFDPSRRFLREFPVPGAIGIDVSGDELLAWTMKDVSVYTLEGELKRSFAKAGRGHGDGLAATYGLASDGTNVYVADANNRTVKAFDKQGKLVWARWTGAGDSTKTAGEDTSTVGDVIQIPQDLVIDGAGRLVVIDAFSFKMVVLDRKDGRILASYGEYGSREALFAYPTGIAYDAERDWFAIADTMNDRVQIVRIPGSGGGNRQAVRRALASPYRICSIPLLLLVIALVILVTGRSRKRGDEDADEVDMSGIS